MKQAGLILLFTVFYILSGHADNRIRVNQIGYLSESPKNAVWVSHEQTKEKDFSIINEQNGKTVYTGNFTTEKQKNRLYLPDALIFRISKNPENIIYRSVIHHHHLSLSETTYMREQPISLYNICGSNGAVTIHF